MPIDSVKTDKLNFYLNFQLKSLRHSIDKPIWTVKCLRMKVEEWDYHYTEPPDELSMTSKDTSGRSADVLITTKNKLTNKLPEEIDKSDGGKTADWRPERGYVPFDVPSNGRFL